MSQLFLSIYHFFHLQVYEQDNTRCGMVEHFSLDLIPKTKEEWIPPRPTKEGPVNYYINYL